MSVVLAAEMQGEDSVDPATSRDLPTVPNPAHCGNCALRQQRYGIPQRPDLRPVKLEVVQ